MREKLPRVSVLVAVTVVSGVVFVGSAIPVRAQTTSSFTVDLGVNSPTRETGKLFNVLSGGGPWEFTVTNVTGTLNTLVLSIRDSSPGDFCHFSSVKRPQAGLVITTAPIPAATVNACGNQYPDVNGPALAFYATFQGGKSAGVSVTVTYPTP